MDSNQTAFIIVDEGDTTHAEKIEDTVCIEIIKQISSLSSKQKGKILAEILDIL